MSDPNDEPAQDIEAAAPVIQPISAKKTIGEVILRLLSVVCMGTSIMAMLVAGDTLVYVVGSATVFSAPASMRLYRKYLEKKASAETASGLSNQANTSQNLSRRISLTTQQLMQQVERVAVLEDTLKMIYETKNHKIKNLEKQVIENERICLEGNKNINTLALQGLLTVLIRNDMDGDFRIAGEEIDKVCADLQKYINTIDGATFYEDRFKMAIRATNGSIKKMMTIIKNMGRGNSIDEESISLNNLSKEEALNMKIFDFRPQSDASADSSSLATSYSSEEESKCGFYSY
eukprot:CAMPEP_0116004460 /NCGR_PEP_ID=MMETSP0321-20121206/612_1 /TAXON_ID=163516 /ORGANISM="Leptocylindrus danicus var. danicus, Strain B650" /LENGTH=289 /DNA_ID=CAMNT_0003472759 /DNA_START=201 /DNA_END=1070 /DNA_ORIENTATION=+